MAPVPPCRHEDERGAALVEFALVVPVLAMFLLGIFSFGMVYDQQLSLTHAAREGARYGVTTPPDQVFVSGSWATNVRDIVVARANGDLDSSAASVCVSLVRGSPATTFQITSGVARSASWFSTNSSGAPCDATETYPVTARDDGLRVQVRVSKPAHIEAYFFRRDITVSAEATAQSEFAA